MSHTQVIGPLIRWFSVLVQWQNGWRVHPDMFPPFLYKGYIRHPNRWKGFLRSDILLAVSFQYTYFLATL